MLPQLHPHLIQYNGQDDSAIVLFNSQQAHQSCQSLCTLWHAPIQIVTYGL